MCGKSHALQVPIFGPWRPWTPLMNHMSENLNISIPKPCLQTLKISALYHKPRPSKFYKIYDISQPEVTLSKQKKKYVKTFDCQSVLKISCKSAEPFLRNARYKMGKKKNNN